MTSPVVEAKARVQAALARWLEARKAVNNPASVPDRLDEIVAVAQRTIATIGQDVVTEVEAIIVELADLRFPVELDEALGTLESATLSLDGALGRLSRAASRAGFADGEDDFAIPPGVRMPAKEIAKELEAFVAAVEGLRPVLERIAHAQASEPGLDSKQEALVRNVIEKASVKIEIVGVKTGKISLIDVSGLTALGRELGRLLQSFISTVAATASRVARWLSQEAPGWIYPVLQPLERGATGLAKGAAMWINRRTGATAAGLSEPPVDLPMTDDPRFDLLEVERMIERGDVPPTHVVPFVTSFSGWDLDQKALSALSHMTALRKLSLGECTIDDLSPLAGLTALQYLSLFDTEVRDLSPLAHLAGLQSLEVHHARVDDLSPLEHLTTLKSLSLTDSEASDLTPLASLTALQSLSLGGSEISDLTPLSGLKALHSLYLGSSKVRDLGPLAGLTALQYLSLSDNEVNELGPLASSTALEHLYLGGSKVRDLSPLADLRGLETLHLDRTQVSDLRPLAGLTALQDLRLGHTWVSDLSPLAGLTALQNLDLADTEVVDLRPLGGLSIQSLSLINTKVCDFSPLRDLPKLREIHTLEENAALVATLGLPVKWHSSHYVINRAA